MTTAARPTQEQSCHWYAKDGTPVYEVKRASGEGMRPTTLADARKLDLLPSVTTILSILRKPQLESWLIEQACLAVLTAPKPIHEALDHFVERILHTERQQDQESDIAKKRGTEIHSAIEGYFNHGSLLAEVMPWVEPAIVELEKTLAMVHTEHILLGDGYAGKCDLIAQDDHHWEWIIDFKTTKKLPSKESYWEHRMQTAAYLKCRENGKRHANVYISTVDCGAFVIHDNGDYAKPYEAFEALRDYWQIANNYRP